MRRVLLGVLLVATSLSGAAVAAGAAPPPGHGPACADIVGAGASVVEPTGSSETHVTAYLDLAADSCRPFTYTLYVFDETGTELIATRTVKGGGGSTVQFDTLSIPAGANACFLATSSVGKHVFDRAPAEECVVVVVEARGEDPTGFEWFP